jgi:hypothetical protein
MDDYKFPDEMEVNAKDTKDEKVEFEVESDDDVKVEVVDDTPEEDRGRKPMAEQPDEVTEEELSKYKDVKLRDRIAHLSKARHEERRAKERAERELQEAVAIAQRMFAENESLKSNAGNNQKVILDQAATVASREMAEAKRAYKEAYEAGNADALVDAQEAITAAKLKADRIELAKQKSLQEVKTPVQNDPMPPAPAREAPAVDEKAVRWKERNDWFNKDREMTGFALAVHERLVDEEGIDPRSDAYYERIDSRMREKFPEKFSSNPKRSNVVAPATRSTAPKKIVLKQSQVALAKRLGIPLDLYAKQVALEMRKERENG